MAYLATKAGSLKTSAVPSTGERKSIISRWIDKTLNAVSNGWVKTNGGHIGPTISARFYSIVGTAAYESWQASVGISKSTVGLSKINMSNLYKYSKDIKKNAITKALISRTIFHSVNNKYSGLTPKGTKKFEQFSQMHIRQINSKALNKIDAISKRIARKVVQAYKSDGFDGSGSYTPINSVKKIQHIDRWTPEYNISGNRLSGIQEYLTPHWGSVTPFGIKKKKLRKISNLSKSPEPFLLDSKDTYNLESRSLFDQSSGTTFSISKDLIGTHINPKFIDQGIDVINYSRRLRNTRKGNSRKATAEFWEDGAGTPFPPGTWMVIGQAMSLEKGLSIAEDARLFQGLGATVHAAAISAWDIKLKENYARPIRVIRELSRLNLLPDDDTGLDGSQFKAFSRGSGKIDMISGVNFETYQLPHGGYSPPFAEYTSGHSTFSSSAAAFIQKFANTNAFPWDIEMELTFPYPRGEGNKITLKYETLQDAARAAGESRLHGGIHFSDGNTQGLLVGEQIGESMFESLSKMWA